MYSLSLTQPAAFTQYESEAIRRAVGVVFEDVTVHFASVEDLIIHKLVAGRAHDIEDVAGPLGRNRSLDEVYLTGWLDSFREIVHRDLAGQLRTLNAIDIRPRNLGKDLITLFRTLYFMTTILRVWTKPPAVNL